MWVYASWRGSIETREVCCLALLAGKKGTVSGEGPGADGCIFRLGDMGVSISVLRRSQHFCKVWQC